VIRDAWGNDIYWNDCNVFWDRAIADSWQRIAEPSKNPSYRPQYVWDTGMSTLRQLLCLFSSGALVSHLSQHFGRILEAWELSNKLAFELNAQLKPGQGWDHRHVLRAPSISEDSRSHGDPRAWIFRLSDLNHYNWCFWLVALALLLEVPDEEWRRLIALIGEEGHDVLLDKVMATRQPDRIIGTTLLHHKPYARLLAAIEAHEEQQAGKLFAFVDNWYAELQRKGNDELWWYLFADPVKHPLEKGSYFGRWCLEAAVAAKAFHMDDSLCIGHESYPSAFLGPDGPGAHLNVEPKKPGLWQSWLKCLRSH